MKKLENKKNLLFEGDCFEVLDWLIEQNIKVDAIITDPPYNLGIDLWDNDFDFLKIKLRIDKILKPGGNLILFTGWSLAPQILKIFDDYNLNNWIIWDRIKGRGAKKNVVSTREDILWFSNKKEYVFNNQYAISNIKKKTGGTIGRKNGCLYRKLSNVWTDISPLVPWCKERKNNNHPSQKPLALMERIVKLFTNEKDTILDFTSGTGSTLEACKNLKRNFIGIEKEKKYMKITCERLKINYEDFKEKNWWINKKKPKSEKTIKKNSILRESERLLPI